MGESDVEMESTPSEDAVKTEDCWMTTQDLGCRDIRISDNSGYYISVVDKVIAEFERIHSNSGRSPIGKVQSNSITHREILRER